MPATSPALTSLELPGIKKFGSGKVREVFDLDDKLLVVVTDRISAFDCVLPTGIPLKGHVLNQLAAWWFKKLEHVIPHHMISIDVDEYPEQLREFSDILKGRSMLVHKADALPVECVARGYLIGSGWKEYQASGTVCGIELKDGYQLADQLEAPIFTPATKAESGHDENISYEVMADITGDDIAAQLRSVTLQLYSEAAEFARTKGIIIADTKFEFGMVNGTLTLIDEALTPDSSRFWPADSYEAGISPPSFDKQYVRDYLETLDWDKTPPAPELPAEVAQKTGEKYREAFKVLTGEDLVV